MIGYSNYYVNDHAQANGDHEVHKESCLWLALAVSKTHLGIFTNCRDAVARAKLFYPLADGCAFCCPECNTR